MYEVPTGVPGPSHQGVSGEVRFGLGMLAGSQQEGSGKRNQSEDGVEVERSLLGEDMEVETTGVSTRKDKGVERGGEETLRATSPSMHAPRRGEEPWQTVGKGGRPLGSTVNSVTVSGRTASGVKNSHWLGSKLGAGGRPQGALGGRACFSCGVVGHYAKWCNRRQNSGRGESSRTGGRARQSVPQVGGMMGGLQQGQMRTAGGISGGRRWEERTTTPKEGGKPGVPLVTGEGDWKKKVEGMVKVEEFVRSRSDFAMVVDFRGLKMTQLGMIAAVAKGVTKVEGLKFVGAELVEVAFISEEDMLGAVEKGMQIGNVMLPVRRCLGMDEEVVVLEVLEMPIMDRKLTADSVKTALKPWGGVFQVKLLEWMGTSIRTGTAVAMVTLKAGQRMGKDWVGKVMVGGRSCVVRRKAEVGSTPVVGSILTKAQMKASAPEAVAEEEDQLSKVLAAGAADMSMVMSESEEEEESNGEKSFEEANKTILIQDGEKGLSAQILQEVDDTGDEEEEDAGRVELWTWIEGQMQVLAQSAVAASQPMKEENWQLLQQTERMVEPLLERLEHALNTANNGITEEMRQHGEWGAQIVKTMPHTEWGVELWRDKCRVVRQMQEGQEYITATEESEDMLNTTILL